MPPPPRAKALLGTHPLPLGASQRTVKEKGVSVLRSKVTLRGGSGMVRYSAVVGSEIWS